MNIVKKRIVILTVCLLSSLSASAQVKHAEKKENKTINENNPGSYVVSLFRRYVSPVDGDRCPSYPTCSSYSIKAFKKHGFIKGWLMTVDRLIHEGSEEKKVSPVVIVDGIKKIYDPVENNDFWWHKKSKEKKAEK